MLLDRAFKNGESTPAWYVGLKGYGKAVIDDTMTSHSSWSEITSYDETDRSTFTPGTISSGSVSNFTNEAQFVASSAFNVFGSFLVSNNTKGGSDGILYGVADIGGSDIGGMSQANPVMVTIPQTSLFTVGDAIRIQGVSGMVEVNNRNFTIGSLVTSPPFTSFTLDGENGTGHTAYTSGGYVSKYRRVEAGELLVVRITLSIANS
jgi:hypothetical protein